MRKRRHHGRDFKLGHYPIFKWRQTSPQLILCAVRWYLRYSLSLRDVEELFAAHDAFAAAGAPVCVKR